GPAYAVSSSVHTWAVAHDLCCHCHPGYGQHLDPDAFPTRRSSDLGNGSLYSRSSILNSERVTLSYILTILFSNFRRRSDIEKSRSEEHTSELQSRFDLVCRLLLDKKKPWIETRPVVYATECGRSEG